MQYPITFTTPHGLKPTVDLFLRNRNNNQYMRLRHVMVSTTSEITLLRSFFARAGGFARTSPPRGVSVKQPYHGVNYDLQFAKVPLRLKEDGGYWIEWDSTVAFWDAPAKCDYLGLVGALEYLDPQIVTIRRQTIVAPNQLFPGRVVP